MARAFILVMDSVGIGGAPDAADYGDAGADTVGHIADAAVRGAADRIGLRAGPLRLPCLSALGLGEACRLATGWVPPGLTAPLPGAAFGAAREISKGKDTPSGHWEIAGLPVTFEWGYFPKRVPCFPANVVAELVGRAGLPGILGDCHASGTEIIAQLGEEHLRTGKPICYTSADSVFQIAGHEEAFGLERLYATCEVARALIDPLRIGRVIARPFIGQDAASFSRTPHRRDFAIPPQGPTLLDIATAAGRDVITIGKIGDIFAHSGTGRVIKGAGNAELMDRTIEAARELRDGGLLMANYIDFDTLHGHRRDVAGYAAALEAFDARLPGLLAVMRGGDLLIVTADHGCDPTWPGTDHTREQVPVLVRRAGLAGSLGRRATFADMGATAASHLGLKPLSAGTDFGAGLRAGRMDTVVVAERP